MTETMRFEDEIFELARNANGLKVFFNKGKDHCLVVDASNDFIIFRIQANCGQNFGYMEIVEELS